MHINRTRNKLFVNKNSRPWNILRKNNILNIYLFNVAINARNLRETQKILIET